MVAALSLLHNLFTKEAAYDQNHDDGGGNFLLVPLQRLRNDHVPRAANTTHSLTARWRNL